MSQFLMSFGLKPHAKFHNAGSIFQYLTFRGPGTFLGVAFCTGSRFFFFGGGGFGADPKGHFEKN